MLKSSPSCDEEPLQIQLSEACHIIKLFEDVDFWLFIGNIWLINIRAGKFRHAEKMIGSAWNNRAVPQFPMRRENDFIIKSSFWSGRNGFIVRKFESGFKNLRNKWLNGIMV